MFVGMIEVRKYSYYRECGTKNICNVGVDCFSRQGNISGHWQGPSYDSLNDVGVPWVAVYEPSAIIRAIYFLMGFDYPEFLKVKSRIIK